MGETAQELRRNALEARLPNGWTLREERWPFPAFIATHDDFDASHEGPEDGWVGNGLQCHAPDFDGLLAEIACIEDEHPHFTDQGTPNHD